MRSLIDIVVFSVEEIQELLETACDISENPGKHGDPEPPGRHEGHRDLHHGGPEGKGSDRKGRYAGDRRAVWFPCVLRCGCV